VEVEVLRRRLRFGPTTATVVVTMGVGASMIQLGLSQPIEKWDEEGSSRLVTSAEFQLHFKGHTCVHVMYSHCTGSVRTVSA
jgi:hypothetical protein